MWIAQLDGHGSGVIDGHVRQDLSFGERDRDALTYKRLSLSLRTP
jgi:hypothetical protein